MPAPGLTVTIGSTPASSLVASQASNAFLVGGAEKGPLDEAVLILSLADFVQKCGGRYEGYPEPYDWVETYFKEGGAALYFSREVGSSAAQASKNIVDAESKIAVKFKAANAGAWGNSLKVAVTNASSKISGTIKLGTKTLLTFSELATNAALITLVNEKISAYVTAETGEAEAAIAKTQELTFSGGSDALGSLTTGTLETALANFVADLGPGQVAAPQHTAEAAHKAMMLHAETLVRFAVLDDDTDSASELQADAAALTDSDGDRFSVMVAPRAIIPGLTHSAAKRTVAYSAVYCGQIARAEGQGYSPNQPPAGTKRGSAKFALELSKIYTDTELAELNDAGVLCAKLVRGVPVTFGNVTLVDQEGEFADWKSASAVRTVMSAAGTGAIVMEEYEFETIDGRGIIFSKLKGDLSNRVCMPLFKNNALHGSSPEEAFAVETGPDVNTPTSIEEEQIRAQIALRTSPTGERLELEIVKVPITETL